MTFFFKRGLICILFLLITSCGIYSFTGASISPNVKTVQVDYFPNYALLVNPRLSQIVTLKLQDMMQNKTDLKIVKDDGDLQFEGEVKGYEITPDNAEANNRAAFSRLTITINVRYYNSKDEKQNFERSFSDYEKFPASQNFSSVENDLIEQILDKIMDKIFVASVANW